MEPAITVTSKIMPEEYHPRKYFEKALWEYERQAYNRKQLCDEREIAQLKKSFEELRKILTAESIRNFPLILAFYNNPVCLRKKWKVKDCVFHLGEIIKCFSVHKEANGNFWFTGSASLAPEDREFLTQLVELSLDYSSFGFFGTEKEMRKVTDVASTVIKKTIKVVTRPLNVWEQRQVIVGMFCAMGVYLINTKLFDSTHAKAVSEGLNAYRKSIAHGNQEALRYGPIKTMFDAVSIGIWLNDMS